MARVALLLLPILFGGCVSAITPPKGHAVEVGEGRALAFGRIIVTDATGEEYPVFSSNLLDVLAQKPALTFELRQMSPPGSATIYKVNPWPPIAGDGAFHWILDQGNYVLVSNPGSYGSSDYDPSKGTELARFTIAGGTGTVYLGALHIVIDSFVLHEVTDIVGDVNDYRIGSVFVVDDGERAFASLRARYPSVPEPQETALMVAGPPPDR